MAVRPLPNDFLLALATRSRILISKTLLLPLEVIEMPVWFDCGVTTLYIFGPFRVTLSAMGLFFVLRLLPVYFV